MTTEQAFLLELIKKSQFPEAIDAASAGEIQETQETHESQKTQETPESQENTAIVPDGLDWDKLYKETFSQSVLCMAWTCFDELPELKNALPEEVRARWKEAENRQLVNYIRYMHAQAELTALMREKEIPFAVLKGLAAAINYRDPSKRAMGDIDFIVPQELFEKTREILLEAGYRLTSEEPDYTRHIAFDRFGVHFELHHHFSHEDRDVERFVIDGIENACNVAVDGTEFSMLPPLGNGIVLLDHMKNHLKSGLGLRQVIDWMMYVSSELNDSFWEAEFRSAAEEARLVKLAKVVTKMCLKYMGLPADNISWCDDADDRLCDDLIENLLVSGNFGRRNGEGNKIENVTASIRREGLFRRLQSAGESNWKAYKKHKWLKPFCWVYQSGRYARQGFKAKRSGTQLKDDLKRAEKRNKLLRELEII